jgi:ABC-type Fe3+/spermidine/putrescine transport system ATPase subunit
MADRVAVMRGGRIEQVGTPSEVYERPATPFVAGFVGTSNLLTGEAAEQIVGTGGTFSVRPEIQRADDAVRRRPRRQPSQSGSSKKPRWHIGRRRTDVGTRRN